MNKVLVVAAHPDDEVLGVGATLCRHAREGDEITIFILGDGETSRSSADIEKRQAQARQAAVAIGAKDVILEVFPDQRFDTVPLLEITQKIEKLVYSLKPDIVYTHCPYDLNLDHRLTFQAVLTALRPGPNLSVTKFSTFETLSSTEWQRKDQANSFCPTEYYDISEFIEKKIELLKIYSDEIRDYPHPRSAEGVKILAQYRGIESGFRYAEAFQIIRLLNR